MTAGIVYGTACAIACVAQCQRRHVVHHSVTECVCVYMMHACRYSYHADLGARLRCALLAAELLPAVFGSDILHPQRCVDFAAYTPLELWPGVDVFADPYRWECQSVFRQDMVATSKCFHSTGSCCYLCSVWVLCDLEEKQLSGALRLTRCTLRSISDAFPFAGATHQPWHPAWSASPASCRSSSCTCYRSRCWPCGSTPASTSPTTGPRQFFPASHVGGPSQPWGSCHRLLLSCRVYWRGTTYQALCWQHHSPCWLLMGSPWGWVLPLRQARACRPRGSSRPLQGLKQATEKRQQPEQRQRGMETLPMVVCVCFMRTSGPGTLQTQHSCSTLLRSSWIPLSQRHTALGCADTSR